MEQNNQPDQGAPFIKEKGGPDIVTSMKPSHIDPAHDILFGGDNSGSQSDPNGNQPVVVQPPSQPNNLPFNGKPTAENQTEFGQPQQSNEPGAQPQPQQQQMDGKPPALTAEQLLNNYKGLQSKYNKLQEDVKPYVDFAKAFEGNEQVRLAALAEYHPDLVKPRDPKTAIKEQLTVEFGEDFEVESASHIDKLLYEKRLGELMTTHFSDKSPHIKTLKQLSADRKAAAKERYNQMEISKGDIMQKRGWNPVQYDNFMGWMKDLSFETASVIYDGMNTNIAQSQVNLGNLSVVNGAPPNQSQEDAENDILFGTRSPNFEP